MENVLKNILPKILPPGYQLDRNYFLRPHSGKSDLQKSIPQKMKAFSHFHEPVLIVILHDQHQADCFGLKQKLVRLCEDNGSCSFLVRIVCRELESWYLGDMAAIEAAYPQVKAKKYKGKARFRDPDRCSAAHEMEKILPAFQKIAASRKISQYMSVNENRSRSFNHFISGLIRVLNRYHGRED